MTAPPRSHISGQARRAREEPPVTNPGPKPTAIITEVALGQPTLLILPDGELLIFEAEPTEDDLSRAYILDVLGIVVTVYVRPSLTTVVHVDTIDGFSNRIGNSLTCEVNNAEVCHLEHTDRESPSPNNDEEEK